MQIAPTTRLRFVDSVRSLYFLDHSIFCIDYQNIFVKKLILWLLKFYVFVLDENLVDSSTPYVDSTEQAEEKFIASSSMIDADESIKSETSLNLDKSPKSLPKSCTTSVKSPLRVSNSQSPVKSPLPKSPVVTSKSPSPGVRSPTASSKSPSSHVQSPLSSSKSPLPVVKSPSSKSPAHKSPISSTRSPVHARSPGGAGVKSPILKSKSPEPFENDSRSNIDSPLPVENEVSGSDIVSETVVDNEKSDNPSAVSHLLYRVEDCEEILTDRSDGVIDERGDADTSSVGATATSASADKSAAVGVTETATNETSISVSSIETTIVYSVSNCSSDISFSDKRDCEISEVSCSTENLEPSFDPLDRLNSNVLGSDVMNNAESDLGPTKESPKSTKIEETLEKPEEEDWEIIKVDPNSSETLQDDQVVTILLNTTRNRLFYF